MLGDIISKQYGGCGLVVNNRVPAVSVTSQSQKRIGLFTILFYIQSEPLYMTEVTFQRIRIQQKRILTIRRISNLPKIYKV